MTRLLDESAKGVYIIAATPFADNGALDLESTDRMTDYYMRVGCDGMTILGVMGEAPKLSPEESAQFAERVLQTGQPGPHLGERARLVERPDRCEHVAELLERLAQVMPGVAVVGGLRT